MWNLVEPGSRFRASAPNHTEALLEEPQAFQAVGEKLKPPQNSNARPGCWEELHSVAFGAGIKVMHLRVQ